MVVLMDAAHVVFKQHVREDVLVCCVGVFVCARVFPENATEAAISAQMYF